MFGVGKGRSTLLLLFVLWSAGNLLLLVLLVPSLQSSTCRWVITASEDSCATMGPIGRQY
jgi:hypothetical protein